MSAVPATAGLAHSDAFDLAKGRDERRTAGPCLQPFPKQMYGRHRDWTLAEYVCQQNNRNFTTDDGKAGINLSFEETK